MVGLDETRIVAVRAVAVRAAIDTPVKTSFGVMNDRPAVFVEVHDEDGARGLGEVWCNFPSVGAEHRARLANAVVGPLLQRLGPISPSHIFERLMAALHILAIQSGEWGPLRQVAAGLDMACHDLLARKAGVPLWKLLGGISSRVAVYASGIGPERPGEVVAIERDNGHTAFKLKVGFGEETDRRSLEVIRGTLAAGTTLMIDANQGWTVEEAIRHLNAYAAYDLTWIEEPIPADRPPTEWHAIASAVPVPMAVGENMNSVAEFEAAIDADIVRFVQPDVAKWGGVSGCLEIARKALAAGLVYCPHYLGGGIGLLTSAHLLAAAGGGGMLEMDTNPNPWRDGLAKAALVVENGFVRLSDAPGLGIELALDDLAV
jgi:D-galactarolactone cycloisomerase